MPSITALIGLGLPARLSNVLGFSPRTIAGIGTAQVGAAPLTTNFTNATTAGGATAFILPSEIAGAGPLMFYVSTATSALVYPPVGGTIQGLGTNAAFTVATLRPAWFVALTPLTWVANYSA